MIKTPSIITGLHCMSINDTILLLNDTIINYSFFFYQNEFNLIEGLSSSSSGAGQL